jgi:hypothetical protein
MRSRLRSPGRILAATAFLACSFLTAQGTSLAQLPQVGLNLSWDDCGSAGLPYTQWLCNDNAGIAGRLYASFVIPPGFPFTLSEVTGAECTFDLYSPQTTVPSWWTFQKPTSCRPQGLAVDFASAPPGCQDYFGSRPSGTVGAFAYDWPHPRYGYVDGVALLRTVQAVQRYQERGPIGPGEWHVLTITLLANRTVGADACAGCQTPVAVWFSRLRITQYVGVGDLELTQPSVGNLVGWQCPAHPATPFGVSFDCVTPTTPRTWGQIKSLYR